MVGKRRTILHHIVIDFNLDADGTPEFGARGPHALEEAIAIRRCKRFAYYTNKLFQFLHTWDAGEAGPSYIDVKIRVCGILNDQYLEEAMRLDVDLAKLPHMSVIRSFELEHDPRGEDFDLPPPAIYYVHPNCINEILDRLSLINSAIIHVQLLTPASSYVDVVQTDRLRDILAKSELTSWSDSSRVLTMTDH